jgi:hypothetical protein
VPRSWVKIRRSGEKPVVVGIDLGKIPIAIVIKVSESGTILVTVELSRLFHVTELCDYVYHCCGSVSGLKSAIGVSICTYLLGSVGASLRVKPVSHIKSRY